MLMLLVVSALLVGHSWAQVTSNVNLVPQPDGASSRGSIVVNGMEFSPCEEQMFLFSANVPTNLAAVNPNVAMVLTYTYQAASSAQVISTTGVQMSVTLMNGNTPAGPTQSITFTPTPTNAPNSATFTAASVTRFDSIRFGAANPLGDSCQPSQLTAPGITGFATVKLALTINVGLTSAGGNTTDITTGAGQVVAYKDGRLQDAFVCPPWGAKTYSFNPTEIEWLPCSYVGLTFYNTAKKYRIKSVTGVSIRMRSEEDLTLSLRLHNVGQDKDVLSTLLQVQASQTYTTITIPINGDPSIKFDQILIAENHGTTCAAAKNVYINEVTLVGLASLPNDYVASQNGVETSVDNDPATRNSPGTRKSGAEDSSRNLLFTTICVHLLALAALVVVV